MTAADTTGRIRHLFDVMHKTTDENGDPIPAGYVGMTDGLGQVEYVDSSTFGGVTDILDLPTAEMDDTLVLAPDGAGGVEFRAEAGGGSGGSAVFPGLPTGTLLRSYTFTGGSTESWTTSAGTLSNVSDRLQLVHTSGAVAIEPSGAANVADGEVQMDFRTTAMTGSAGVLFRVTDASNFYAFIFESTTGPTLYKCVAGGFTALTSFSPVYPQFRTTIQGPHRLLVRFNGTFIQFYADGTYFMGFKDATFSTGRVGIRCDNSTIQIDNVTVYDSIDLVTGNVSTP